MDYTELLPPLPEQAAWGLDMHGHIVAMASNAEHARGMSPGCDKPLFTEDQLRAAQLAAIAAAAPAIRKAERERCAAVCEAVNAGNTFKNSPLGCAAAIRALPEEP